MGARGFNIVQEGHIVPVLNPASISGGVTGQIFSMRDAAKCAIIIGWGALAAAQGAVTLSACSDLAGDNATAIAFDRWTQTTAGAGNDVLGARTAVTSAGFTPSDTPSTLDVIEVQADQLPDGKPYLKLAIADGTNADFGYATAILTGLRYQGESNPSVTV
jgi:hypothetical protein